MALQKCGLNLNHLKKELQPHGTASFPCAGYASSHDTSREGIIPWHWHEEIEIIRITEGVMQINIPDQTLVLHSGELAVIKGNTLHSAIGKPFGTMHVLVFSPDLITGGRETDMFKKYLDPLLSCEAFTGIIIKKQEITDCFDLAFRSLETDEFGYEFTVREHLSKIMLYVYRESKPNILLSSGKKTSDNIRIGKMMDYIHNHFNTKLSLADICACVDIGERECLRCFRRTIGETPIQYLLKYRLMRSAQLLISEPAMSVLDTAMACGFDSPGYYSRMFRRFYKCSPREYRQENSPDH